MTLLSLWFSCNEIIDWAIEIGACSGIFKNVTFTVYGVPANIALTLEKYGDVKGEGTISQVYRKNTLARGLIFTQYKEYLYINVSGTLEVVD